MCGIVGFLGKLTKARLAAFEEMLLMDVLRGTDSVGVAAISKNNIDIVKDICWPDELLESNEYLDNVIKKQNNIFCLIGHNRLSTRGRSTVKNAHPFQHKNITLVHNGTAFVYRLPADYGKFDTDSEIICHGISEWGIEKAWSNIDGAATLLYWDSIKNKLCLIANGKRPMNFVWLKDHEGVFFASEAWMFHAVCERFNIKKEETKALHFYPVENRLYEFEYTGGRVEMTSIPLTPFKDNVRSNSTYRGSLNGTPGWWRNGVFDPDKEEKEKYLGDFSDYGDVEEREHAETCTCHECMTKWADKGADIGPDPNVLAIKIPGHDEGCLCRECETLRADMCGYGALERQSFRHHKGCDCSDCKVALMHPVWCDCVKCSRLSFQTQEERQFKKTFGEQEKSCSLLERREQEIRKNNSNRHTLLKINIFKKHITEDEWRAEYKSCCSCGCSLAGEYDLDSIVINYNNRHALCSDCVKTGLDAGLSSTQLENMVTVH